MINIKEAGDIRILEIQGRIDDQTYSHLRDTITSLVNMGKTKIICTMEVVDYVSPTGLKVFLEQIRLVRKNGGDVKLCAVQAGLQKILEMYNASEFGTIYKDLKLAQKAFQSTPAPVAKAAPAKAALSEEDQYGATMQFSGSPANLLAKKKEEAAKVQNAEDMYGATMQMPSSPLKIGQAKKPETAEEYGATMQMSPSNIAQIKEKAQAAKSGAPASSIKIPNAPADMDAYERTMQMDPNAIIQARAAKAAANVATPAPVVSKAPVMEPQQISDDAFMVEGQNTASGIAVGSFTFTTSRAEAQKLKAEQKIKVEANSIVFPGVIVAIRPAEGDNAQVTVRLEGMAFKIKNA